MGYLYGDYSGISFTDTETSYRVGTDSSISLISENTLLKADQDCLVRFNASDAVQQSIEADTYYTFQRNIHTIYVVRVTVSGTLKMWAEGDILE